MGVPLLVVKIRSCSTQALDQIGRALKEKGIDLDDQIERGHGLRGELIEEEYQISDSQAP